MYKGLIYNKITGINPDRMAAISTSLYILYWIFVVPVLT